MASGPTGWQSSKPRPNVVLRVGVLGRLEDAMKDSDRLYPDGTVLEVDFGLKSGDKNPNGPWEIKKATMRVDVTGLTRKDVEADLLGSWKIKRARCRATMTREAAYQCMTRQIHWSEVGKVASLVNVEDAYKAKFSTMSKEKQAEQLAVMEQLMKSGFGK